MRRLMAVILSVALLCSCNKKSEKIVPAPDSVDNNLQVSENADIITYPSNYLAEEITVEGWGKFRDIKYCDKNLYLFALHETDYINKEYFCNNLSQNTTYKIPITYSHILAMTYSENGYYTIEYDEDNNLYICSYDSNSEKIKSSVQIEPIENFINLSDKLVKSGDYLYYIFDSTATLYDQNLRKIHTIDFGQYFDKFSIRTIVADENHNIYTEIYDYSTNDYTLMKLNSDGTIVYKEKSSYEGDRWSVESFINENKLFIYYYSSSEEITTLNIIDTLTGKLLANYRIENNIEISVGYDDYDVCIKSENDIYGLDFETMERTFLYNISDNLKAEKKDVHLCEWLSQNKELTILTSQNDSCYKAILSTDDDLNIKNTYKFEYDKHTYGFFCHNNEIYGIITGYKPQSFNVVKSSDGINFSEIITNLYIDDVEHITDFWIDKENNYYFVYNYSSTYYLTKYDSNGKILNNKALPIYKYIFHKTHTDSEKIYFSDDSYSIYSMDLQQNMKTEKLYSSNTYYKWYDTSLNSDSEIFAYSDDTKIMNVFDLSHHKMKELFDFTKLPLLYIYEFTQISEREYILSGLGYEEKEYIYKITVSDEKYEEYKVLTIAGHDIPLYFKEAILNFCNEHQNVHVVYEDCRYNSNCLAKTQSYHELDGAIISKNIPDIIISDEYFDYQKYEDFFLDMTEHIKTYKNNCYDYAFKVSDNGAITHFIPYLHNQYGFYIQEANNFFENNDLKSLIDYLNLNKDILDPTDTWADTFIELYIHKYQDFNTDIFKSILEFLRDIEQEKPETEDDNRTIKIRIMNYIVSSSNEYDYVGVPDASFIIDSFEGFAISKSSENKDVALEFLNHMMQYKAYKNTIPKYASFYYTNKKSLKERIKYNQNDFYTYIMNPHRFNKNLFEHSFSRFDNNAILTKKGTQLFSIVKKEVDRFLTDNLTVEETIENIQSKVSAK